MYAVTKFCLFILILNIGQVESYSCSCSCCFGQGCQPTQVLNTVTAQQCTDSSCLEACRARYYQCNVAPPNGQAVGRCLDITTTTTTSSPLVGGQFLCQCFCCRDGSYSCPVSFVGYTYAFVCHVGACSIACTKQYPTVCVNDQFGQTQSVCAGSVTSTPLMPSGSVRCGCSCQGATGLMNYEIITANGCSSCNSSCQSVNIQCSAHQNTYCLN